MRAPRRAEEAKAGGFAEEERSRIATVADVLIPAWGNLPSASTAGVVGSLLEKALRARPDLAESFARSVANLPETPTSETVQDLIERDYESYLTILTLLLGAYYMSDAVKGALGYSGQEALRIDVGALPAYYEEGLLEEVSKRGPIYRQAPADTI